MNDEEMKNGGFLAETVVWLLVGLIGAAIIGGLAIVWVIYMSVAWPWYLYRGLRRIALPR